jgi:O-antigen/teichoic acid export membrane protein
VSARGSYRGSVAYGGLAFAATALFGVVTSIVIARLYGIEVVGEYALVIAPTSALWFLSTAGERIALQRELATLEPRTPRATALAAATLTFSFALRLVAAVLMMVAVWFLYRGPIEQPDLFWPAVVNMAGFLVAANTAWHFDAVLASFRAGRDLFWLRNRYAVAYLVYAIVGGVIADSVWALTLATVASHVTALIRRVRILDRYLLWRIPRSELRAGFRALPAMIRFGIKLAPAGVAEGVSNESGVWILGATTPVATVGAYSRAWTLGQRFRTLPQRVTEVLLPTLVERRAKGDAAGFDRALVDSIRVMSILMLAIAAAGGGAAYGIMALFGPGFDVAANALAIIMVLPALSSALGIVSQALLAHDRPGVISITASIRSAIGLGLSLLLIWWLGITGAALAVAIGYVAELTYFLTVARRFLSTSYLRLWPAHQMAALALAYAGGFLAARLVNDAVVFPLGVFAALLAGVAAFALVLLVGGGLTARDRERIAAMRRRLRRRARTSPPPPSPRPRPAPPSSAGPPRARSGRV